LELVLQGKYNARIDLARLPVGGFVGKIRNIPPFLSFAYPKERNKEKGSQKQKLRCFWQANAHKHSSKSVNTFCFRADSLKAIASCLFVIHGGAVFFVCFS
jgi:hypothetical protein